MLPPPPGSVSLSAKVIGSLTSRDGEWLSSEDSGTPRPQPPLSVYSRHCQAPETTGSRLSPEYICFSYLNGDYVPELSFTQGHTASPWQSRPGAFPA